MNQKQYVAALFYLGFRGLSNKKYNLFKHEHVLHKMILDYKGKK